MRNIVGVLVEVGKGKLRPKDVKDMLDVKNRSLVHYQPAPAQGLHLVDVLYEPNELTALDRSLQTIAKRTKTAATSQHDCSQK